MFVDIIKFICSRAELVHEMQSVQFYRVLHWFIPGGCQVYILVDQMTFKYGVKKYSCLRFKVSFFRQTTLCKRVIESRRFANTQFRHLHMCMYPRILPEHFDIILLRKARIRLPTQTHSNSSRTKSLASPLSRVYSSHLLQQIS